MGSVAGCPSRLRHALGWKDDGEGLPPIPLYDLRQVMSYNMDLKHIQALYTKFVEHDIDCNAFWTVDEVYRMVQEPKRSVRAPVIERIFKMADSSAGTGALPFQDFLVAFTSFCALTREEVLQFLFIIIDVDRSGHLTKEELADNFSYVPEGSIDHKPLYPVNNKNALDKFRGGTWLSLEFDGLSQLCQHFPYIAFPAFHLQQLFRSELLGHAFWERLDRDRQRTVGGNILTRRVKLPGHRNEFITVRRPGRCTMKDLLEYSRRKTALVNGRRVESTEKSSQSSFITQERDRQIARMPLVNMIRNFTEMYHVPPPGNDVVKAAGSLNERPELELPGFHENQYDKSSVAERSVAQNVQQAAARRNEDDEDEDGSDWTDATESSEDDPDVEAGRAFKVG